MPAHQVPLPPGAAGTPAGQLVTGVARWITAAPLRTLVAHFGGAWPGGDLGGLLAALDDFSARHWDFRAGRERPEAREPELDPATARLVLDTATALGMVRPVAPARSDYAHLVVLGGLAHACLRRTAHAAQLARSGPAVTGEVAVLGSFRPLSPVELETLADAGIDGCATEVDALDAGVRAAFAVSTPAEQDGTRHPDPHASWSSRTYHPASLPPVRVLAAPSTEPALRRAHTADTQRFWAGRVALSPGDPVLMVTAPIYVPFQHCDALRTLAVPFGCGIDTVGIDPTAPWLRALPEPTLTPGRYLQEIRSAIRAMRALHRALESGPDQPNSSSPSGPSMPSSARQDRTDVR